MRSRGTPRFWQAYEQLPPDIKAAARKAYRLFREHPAHPSLHFKKVHEREPVYSARITRAYRALAVVEQDDVTWFWIGNHDQYERLLNQL